MARSSSCVTRDQRGLVLGGRFCGCTLWLTGLSAAGKTTIAFAIEEYLVQNGFASYVLDGDNIRLGLCSDLDFSTASCLEHSRRVSELALLFSEAGVITVCAVISPIAASRTAAKRSHQQRGLHFFEIFVRAHISTCVQRDPKGVYRASAATTANPVPYEEPARPDLIVDTSLSSVTQCVLECISLLVDERLLPSTLLNAAKAETESSSLIGSHTR